MRFKSGRHSGLQSSEGSTGSGVSASRFTRRAVGWGLSVFPRSLCRDPHSIAADFPQGFTAHFLLGLTIIPQA